MFDNQIILANGQATIEAAAGDQNRSATITAPAYSGGILVIAGTGHVIDLAGMSMPLTVPLLCDHANEIGAVAGSVRPTKRGGRLDVEGNLARGTEAADRVIALSAAGVELAVSVGVEPETKEYIAPGQTVTANGQSFVADDSGLVFVRKSNLKEISLVPIGADSSAFATIAAAANTKGGQATPTIPTFDQYLTANGFDPVATTTDMKLALRASYDAQYGAGVDAERIVMVADAFAADITGSERGRALRAAATKGQINASGYEAGLTRIQSDFARADLQVAARPTGPAIHSSSQDVNSHPDILTAAFCRTAGLHSIEKQFSEPVREAADRQYRSGLGLQEMLLRCAGEAGYTGRGVIRSGNLKEVLRAAFSTHTMTTLLTNAGNQFLTQGFDSVESVWRELSVIRPVQDFKQNTRFRMTSGGSYEELTSGGAIAHGSLGQESYTVQAKTFAKMFAITRTDIINDDLGAFDSLRKVLGRGGGLKLNDVFWRAFMDNAAFFTAARGNYQEGGATALSLTSLEDAEVLFSDITDASGNPLGQEAAILLTPKAISGTARTLYKSTEVRDTTASTERPITNIFEGKYKPLASSYLNNSNYTGNSALAWYLLADPAVNPVMEVTFLDGRESPTIEQSDADFNQLGIQFRGYHDFDCAKSEWRGGVKSKGEA